MGSIHTGTRGEYIVQVTQVIVARTLEEIGLL